MTRAAIHGIRFGLVLLVLLAPAGVHSLGLGEARVDSFLNQRLEVRMRLLDATDLDVDSLTVAPASPEDFDRLGLSSRALSLDLDVEVDGSVSPPIVRITSRRPVTDPVVQLVIDARWSGGRMLREYTLFLDPPTVEAMPPPAPAPEPEPARETTASAEPERRSSSRPPAEPAPPSRPVQARNTEPGRYGPVAAGETLWSIARDNLPAGDVTMDQMMIAIVELNPSAFRDGNINRLLRGARLDLPDADRARAIDSAEAAALVAAQMRAFNRGDFNSDDLPRVSDAGRDTETDQDASAAAESGDTGTAGGREEPVEPRLSLVPPGDAQGGGASGEGDSVEALRQQLARAEEELYAARQEAEEFQSRVEELEQLVRDNPGGLGLRDADLAGLEATLRAAREATRDDADPELRAEVSARLGDYLDRMGEGDDDAAMADAAVTGEERALADAADSDEALGADALPDSSAAEVEEAAVDSSDSEPASDEAGSTVTEVGRSGGWPSWLPWAAGVVVLLIIGAGVARWFQQRRQAATAETPAVRGEEPEAERPEIDLRSVGSEPADRARARLSEAPDDLDRHVALLELLAAERREEEFSNALESMFEHVDSGSEPQWRKALRLAGGIVPGHLLVKGSADWVADTGDERSEPATELDQDADVDELMARLEADDDEAEGDGAGAASSRPDDEWPEFDEPAEQPEEGDRTSDESLDFDAFRDDARGDDQDESWTGDRLEPDEDAGFAFDLDSEESGAEDRDEDEQPAGLEFESPSTREGDGDTEAGEPEPETDRDVESGTRTEGSAAAPGDEDYDSPTLEWPEFGEYSGDEAIAGDGEDASDESAPAAGAPIPETGDDAREDEEIFGQSDDDIDVKLDLARAYLSWDSADSARTLLEEVLREGNEGQREQARKLLDDQAGESGD